MSIRSRQVMKKILVVRLCFRFARKAVSHPSNGFNIMDVQFFSEIFNMGVYDAFVSVKVIAPDPVEQHLPGEHLALVLEEGFEQLELPLG